MSLANGSPEPNPPDPSPDTDTQPSSTWSSMADYFTLVRELYLITLILTAGLFGCIWLAYSLQTALSYLLGSCVGVLYLRMLAKNVAELGVSTGGLGKARLALFVGVIILATQREELQFLPVFLGFLTYKAALLIYAIRLVSTS